jgi:Ca-activated chloride channel homolog
LKYLKVKGFKLFAVALCLLFSVSSYSQQRPKQEKQTTRILFVFDASFSMYGQWQSGQKIDIAKKMLGEFLDSLVAIPDLEIAFRAYGHQSKLVPVRNCKDTKLEVPFATPKKNVPLIIQRLKSIIPMGTTPIAYSLEQCGGDFPPRQNVRNIIILITDGIEECDGDPCAVSMALQKQGIVLKPFVIGIGMDQSFINTFGCIGKYYDVSNEVNFKSVLNVVISQALNNTTAQVNLLDNGGKPTETDVNMTFYDEFSGAIRYNYMHTINNRGNPDTVILDPLATYKLVVHTIPPVEKSNITLTPGKHTIIALDAPQGYLNLKINGINNYKSLQCIVRKSGEMQTLNVQEFNETEKYIIGKYDLEILTLPRIYLPDIHIKQSSTNTVSIPQAGMISIQKPGEGSGSLYIEEKNKMIWVCNLNSNMLSENILLQPGRYRIEFRPKSAKESIYTIERQFKIESGSTTSVKLY